MAATLQLYHLFSHSDKARPILSSSFDSSNGLYWAVSADGHIASYYLPSGEKYTAWKLGVITNFVELVPVDLYVCVVYATEIHVFEAGGVLVATTTRDEKDPITSACPSTLPHTIYLCYESGRISLFDVISMRERKSLQTSNGKITACCATKQRFCVGTADGDLHIYNHSWNSLFTSAAVANEVKQIATDGNRIAVVGSGSSNDVLVFDTKRPKLINTIQLSTTPLGASFVTNPVLSLSSVAVTDSFGQVHVYNATSGSVASLTWPLNIHPNAPTTIATSPSNEIICVCDTGGVVHVFSTLSEGEPTPTTVNMSQMLVHANDVQRATPIDIDDTSKSLGFMLVESTALSSSEGLDVTRTTRPVTAIPKDILQSLQFNNHVGFCPNMLNWRTNQVQYPHALLHQEKARALRGKTSKARDEALSLVPRPYRKHDLKYSRGGLMGFDFHRYNATPFLGLEGDIPNAYANALLQVLFYLAPVQALCVSHFCTKDGCLVCELGFLFQMMRSSEASSCQATNFLYSFRTSPLVAELKLLESELTSDYTLQTVAQLWFKFIISQMMNTIVTTPKLPRVASLVGVTFTETQTCAMCKMSVDKIITQSTIQITAKTSKERSIGDLLTSALKTSHPSSVHCPRCKGFEKGETSTVVRDLPEIMALGCNMTSDTDKELWVRNAPVRNGKPNKPRLSLKNGTGASTSLPLSWIPTKLTFTRKKGKKDLPEITEAYLYSDDHVGEEGKEGVGSTSGSVDHAEQASEDGMLVEEYNLMGAVYHIKSKSAAGLLVSVIKVPSAYAQDRLRQQQEHSPDAEGEKSSASDTPSDEDGEWLIFNDFVVTRASVADAVSYDMAWKAPAVLIYVKAGGSSSSFLDLATPPVNLYKKAFLTDRSLALHPPLQPSFLRPKESNLPRKGDVVAIDAEFVCLRKQDASIRSNKDEEVFVVKPAHMAVARISVVLCSGPNKGLTIIDDYIHIKERVVDFLTQYSGIHARDLDAATTPHYLTTLKQSYAKLMYMVASGVQFVGHGLQKDFRVINISIPTAQVHDTVMLYKQSESRWLSLRYLAWYFLDIMMQTSDTHGHDSVEDSITAWKLYEKYLDLSKDKERWEELLDDVYNHGIMSGYQPPSQHGILSPYIMKERGISQQQQQQQQQQKTVVPEAGDTKPLSSYADQQQQSMGQGVVPHAGMRPARMQAPDVGMAHPPTAHAQQRFQALGPRMNQPPFVAMPYRPPYMPRAPQMTTPQPFLPPQQSAQSRSQSSPSRPVMPMQSSGASKLQGTRDGTVVKVSKDLFQSLPSLSSVRSQSLPSSSSPSTSIGNNNDTRGTKADGSKPAAKVGSSTPSPFTMEMLQRYQQQQQHGQQRQGQQPQAAMLGPRPLLRQQRPHGPKFALRPPASRPIMMRPFLRPTSGVVGDGMRPAYRPLGQPGQHPHMGQQSSYEAFRMGMPIMAPPHHKQQQQQQHSGQGQG